MKNLRSFFPLFKNNPVLVYLDNAATTQKPEFVLKTMDKFYREENANVHRGIYKLSERATLKYEDARGQVAEFLNAKDSSEIVFTRGTTEAINMVAQAWGMQNLKRGDEVVLTILEHHSNLVPWQIVAKKTGAVLKFAPILRDAGTGAINLDYDAISKLITPRTKIISVTGLSNVLGILLDLPRIVKMARKVGTKICVDAAQLVAHFPIDVQKLDVDFLAFSGHKVYGPTGIGVLYAKRRILDNMDPWLFGGDMIREVRLNGSTWNDAPWKFEAGTPPIAEAIGLGAAIGFIKEVGWDFMRRNDEKLMKYAVKRLKEIKEVKLFGVFGNHPTGSFSFEIKGVHSHDVAAILAEKNVCVRAGHHCCMPLMKELGVSGTCRVSFSVYNNFHDIDRLIQALSLVKKIFL